MSETCSLKCTQYTLLGYSCFIWISAVALLGTSIWLRYEHAPLDPVLSSVHLSTGDYLLIAGAIIAFLVAVPGCYGAYRQKKPLLIAFFFLLFIVFAVKVASGIVTYYYYDEVEKEVRPSYNSTFFEHYNKDTKYQKAVEEIERRLSCCGYFGSQTYIAAKLTPSDACKSTNLIRTQGCIDKLETYTEDQLFIVGTVGLGFAAIELIGMVLTCCLYKALSDTYDDPTK